MLLKVGTKSVFSHSSILAVAGLRRRNDGSTEQPTQLNSPTGINSEIGIFLALFS